MAATVENHAKAMTSQSDHPKPVQPAPIWIRLPFFIGAIAGVLPLAAARLGFSFFPAPDWVDLVNPAAKITGLASAILMIGALLRGLWVNDLGWGWIKKICVGFSTPFFGYWIGYVLLISVAPMAAAVVGSHNVGIFFAVARTDGSGNQRCDDPIILDNLPFILNRLCDCTEDFKRALSVGDTIILTGRGTRFGVFPTSACQMADLQ